MLTHLTVRNFKRFGELDIELGSPVVFIGPNNSGKTSAMQALALWNIGLKRWNERRGGTAMPDRRPGVTVNRRDLFAIPVPTAKLLWRGLHTRNAHRVEGRQRTDNVRIEITVQAVSGTHPWKCGLEFDFANSESFYCRPLRLGSGKEPERMPIPEEAAAVEVAFLPPMSGLAATETRLDPGAVDVRVGEGRTAEVLRNLCYRVHQASSDSWDRLVDHIEQLFGAQIEAPSYVSERGEITMDYREGRITLDISSSGRGLQQTLLILAYLYANPGAVLLLDEPDAHLEILRQRQTYRLITETASETGSQIIAASHSEVLLNEAAGKDTVVAFVGKPHRIDNRGSQILKSLESIGFEHYAQAEQTGWVLYLEGSTDLAILQQFAQRLNHARAIRALERPYVQYVENQLKVAENHYYGLREALPDLQSIVILDSDAKSRPDLPPKDLSYHRWQRREIENYLCTRATLEAYAKSAGQSAAHGPLLQEIEVTKHLEVMSQAVDKFEQAMATLRQGSPWSDDVKVSDKFLTPLFASYFDELGIPNLMHKNSFYKLVDYVPETEIDPEISEKLDAIADTAERAKPATET